MIREASPPRTTRGPPAWRARLGGAARDGGEGVRHRDPVGLADDRRQLHDPVRRGGRSADRARLRLRRLRDHAPMRPTCSLGRTTRSSTCRSARGLEELRFGHPVGYLGAVFTPRRGGLRLPRPGPRRLHRLRHRRPPRTRARLRRRCDLRDDRRGLPRRLVAGLMAGGVALGISGGRCPPAARHHAGGGDPAGLLGGRRLPDVRGDRQASRRRRRA